MSIRKIAKTLIKSPSTISREIKNGSVLGDYVYLIADIKAQSRSWHKHSMYLLKYQEFTNLFKQIYNKKYCGVYLTMHLIKEKYPNVICPSERQVFRWIKSNRWVFTKKDRLRGQYYHVRKRKVGVFGEIKRHVVKPIWARPKKIDLRLEIGHWEGDLVLGKRARGYKNILTLNDMCSRKLYTDFVSNKNPFNINKTIKQMILKYDLPFHSLTLDNGLEFQAIGALGKEMKFDIYICEPYASFQRGSNENLNGMIRRFLKKDTDSNPLTEQQLQENTDQINSMKRKCLIENQQMIYETKRKKAHSALNS